jgi:hypothetical protein
MSSQDPNFSRILSTIEFQIFADADLIQLRAALEVEMKRRKLAVSVGQIAEELAIRFFNSTVGCPNLLPAPT